MSQDLQALRAYVTAKDESQYDDLSESTICLNITHSNLRMEIREIRFDKHMTISEVKEKIYKHCGTKPMFMELIIRYGGSEGLYLNDDTKMIGYYPLHHGMDLHIIDNDPFSLSKGGHLEDTSLIKKYEISEEDYDKRKKTVRAYKREQLAKDPNWKPPHLQPRPSTTSKPMDPEFIKSIKVDCRCEVQPGSRRGTIKFVGEIPLLGSGGLWIGVQFDEPVGKCDGSVKGISYFQCLPNYGGFVRAQNIAVGDYPEEDPFEDSDSDEI